MPTTTKRRSKRRTSASVRATERRRKTEPTAAGLPLMDERAAAEYLGMTPRFLQLARMKGNEGKGPPFIRISNRAIRYRPEDLSAWVEQRQHAGTS